MLKTARLYLRNLRSEDADAMYAYRNDRRCNLHQRYDDTSMAYLQKFVQDFSHCTFLSREEEQHYAIVSSAEDEMIGDISVFYSEADNCFTLGITIAPQFQKQGYAYELLKELIAQLQEQYSFTDLVALIEKDNAASIALFERLDFVMECFADSIQSYVYTIYGKNHENE